MDAARMVRMVRRRAGITQSELARRSGVPQPTISRIERELVSPTTDTLEAIVKACGMELESIERPGDGIDRSLIVENLRRTPAQRLAYMVAASREIRRMAERARVVSAR